MPIDGENLSICLNFEHKRVKTFLINAKLCPFRKLMDYLLSRFLNCRSKRVFPSILF